MNARVVCQEGDATDFDIDLTNPAIATTVSIDVMGGRVVTAGELRRHRR